MKKLILLPLSAMVLLVAGCNQEEVDYSDDTRLTMRVHVDQGSEEGNGYTQIITNFNREYKDKIRVELEFVARSGGVY